MDNDQKLPVDAETLSAYLDDELNGAEREVVEAHLAASETARRTLAELTRLRDLFAEWAPPKPDPSFVDRVGNRIAFEADRAGFVRPWRLFMQQMALAAMLLIAVGTLVFVNHRLHNQVEVITLETYLNGSLDRDVREVATAKEGDLSKDLVLDLALSDRVR